MTTENHHIDIDITGKGPEHWEELTPDQLTDAGMSLWEDDPSGDAEHVGNKAEALAWLEAVAAQGLLTEQALRDDYDGETTYRVALTDGSTAWIEHPDGTRVEQTA